MTTGTVKVTWGVGAQSAWPNFPAGTKYGNYKVQITGGNLASPLVMNVPPSSIDANGNVSATFLNVPVDDPPAPSYVASVQMMAADGVTALGSPQTSAPFNALSPVQVPVPSSISVSVTVP